MDITIVGEWSNVIDRDRPWMGASRRLRLAVYLKAPNEVCAASDIAKAPSRGRVRSGLGARLLGIGSERSWPGLG